MSETQRKEMRTMEDWEGYKRLIRDEREIVRQAILVEAQEMIRRFGWAQGGVDSEGMGLTLFDALQEAKWSVYSTRKPRPSAAMVWRAHLDAVGAVERLIGGDGTLDVWDCAPGGTEAEVSALLSRAELQA